MKEDEIKMKFGVSFLPDGSPETKNPQEYFDAALSLSIRADELGLGYVKMTEHYIRAYGGYCPSPFAFLAAVATRTSQIRLMTGGCLPSFHNPLQIASEAAMVDAISHGRLEVGMARAYLPYEFDAFNVPLDGSRERFAASVDAIIRLWEEDAVTIETPFFKFSDVTSLPRPTQKPRPPVLIAAVRTRSSFERIGRMGLGLLMTSGTESGSRELVEAYRDTFRRHHADSGREPRVVASMPMLIADSQSRAQALADRHLEEYLRVWTNSTDSWNQTRSGDYANYSGMSAYLRSLSGPRMRAQGMALVGTAEYVEERTRAFSDNLGGLDAILWQLDFGGLPLEAATESLELLVAHSGSEPNF